MRSCVIAVLAILCGCGPDRRHPLGPDATETKPGSTWAPPSASFLTTDEAFNCTDVDEVRVRFSSPGFVDGSHVGLFVLYEGLPPGEKRLRIWWDEENEPTLFQTLSLGEGERQRQDPDKFTIERVIEHRYLGVREEEIRRVRVELTIEDRPDNCARVREIVVSPGGNGAPAGDCLRATGRVFYVDNAAGPNGDGSLAAPFTDTSDAHRASSPGDWFYVFRGTGATYRSLPLSDRHLVGQGIAFCDGDTFLPEGAPPNFGDGGTGISVGGTAERVIAGITVQGTSGASGFRSTIPVIVRNVSVLDGGMELLDDATITNSYVRGAGAVSVRRGASVRMTNVTARGNVANEATLVVAASDIESDVFAIIAIGNGAFTRVDNSVLRGRVLVLTDLDVTLGGSGNVGWFSQQQCDVVRPGTIAGAIEFASINGGGPGRCPP